MKRTASDRMAECIIEMVHEYKQTINHLNDRIDILTQNVNYWKKATEKAVNDCDSATDKLGEIAEIIAGITEHTDNGILRIYLSDSRLENNIKLKRLFELLDIPMTADQEGDDKDED